MLKKIKTATKKVSKKVINFINDDYTSLPLAEREQMFKAELEVLMKKYNVGLSIVISDATPLPVIQA